LLSALKGTPRRALEIWALAAASALALLFAGYSCRLAWQWKLLQIPERSFALAKTKSVPDHPDCQPV